MPYVHINSGSRTWPTGDTTTLATTRTTSQGSAQANMTSGGTTTIVGIQVGPSGSPGTLTFSNFDGGADKREVAINTAGNISAYWNGSHPFTFSGGFSVIATASAGFDIYVDYIYQPSVNDQPNP